MDEVGLKATAVSKEVTGQNVDFVVTVVPTGPYTAVLPEEMAAPVPVSRFSKIRANRAAAKSS